MFLVIGVVNNVYLIYFYGYIFYVVYVGYLEYNLISGFVGKYNSDIYCDDVVCIKKGCNKSRCIRLSWKKLMNFFIDSYMVRKDIVMVFVGGYVVINFLFDNFGWWFFYCYIEVY